MGRARCAECCTPAQGPCRASLLHPAGGTGPVMSTLSPSTQGHNPQLLALLHIPAQHWVEGAGPLPSASLMRRRGSLESREKRQPRRGPHLPSTVRNQSLPKRLIFSCSPPWGKQNLVFPRGWSPGGGGGRKRAGTARNYQGKLLPSCTFSARTSQETEQERTGGRARQETVLSAGKAFFGFIILSFCSYYFSEGGGELSWGISLKVYITGEKNIHFLSNRENFLDADKYHCPEG